jgi:hypothetical protein
VRLSTRSESDAKSSAIERDRSTANISFHALDASIPVTLPTLVENRSLDRPSARKKA